MIKRRIMAPGPTEVPPTVLAAAGQPILHHRTPQFRAIFQQVSEDIKYVFQTKQPVLTFAAGGTGGMEAIVQNLSKRDEKILAISGGVFGERWAKIGEALGRNVVRLTVNWGEAADPKALHKLLTENPEVVLVCATLNETSTGVEHPIESLSAAIRAAKPDCLFAVDTISGLGACVFKMDDWKVDAAVAGTQKGLMMPPGLAMIALSERAIKRAETAIDVFYWSFTTALQKLTEEKLPDTPYTPNVSLVMQLKESLRLIHEETLEKIWDRHQLLARATRNGVEALGFKLFAPSAPSPGVTSVHVPGGVTATQILKKMRDEWGISIVGGQGKLKESIFRIGHLGYVDRTDILMTLSTLEVALAELGVKVDLGKGTSAAQRVFLESH